MKIAYVIDSLASKGGAERILSDKMNYMAEHFGYDVYVITCYQNTKTDPNVYYLSDKVKQVNLSIHYYAQYHYRYPMRIWVKSSIYRRMKNGLTAAVQQIDPDVLVGLGYFNADLVCGIKCRAKKIVESHEARIFTMSDRGLNRSFFSREYMKFYRNRYFRRIEKTADVVVTLTNGDAKEWTKAKRIEVIPNFTVMPVVKQSTCDNKRVIAVGRLEWQKGFDRLIEAWSIVNKKHSDWQLAIFGSGSHESSLKQQISNHGLCNVTIHSFTPDINKEYSESSVFVLSSRFEGFGLVLLEAMQSGLPCVTFDCPFGPSDVVGDRVNGFVVPDGDIPAFAEKLSLLLEDDTLRKTYSQNSVERAKLFDVRVVMSRWKTLIEDLCSQRA